MAPFSAAIVIFSSIGAVVGLGMAAVFGLKAASNKKSIKEIKSLVKENGIELEEQGKKSLEEKDPDVFVEKGNISEGKKFF